MMATRDMIKAWNLSGVDWKGSRIIYPGQQIVELDSLAIVTVGSNESENLLGYPFTNLGRLETFAGQAFITNQFSIPIFPIPSPYSCKTSEDATVFYRAVSNFWPSVRNPVKLGSTFEEAAERFDLHRKALLNNIKPGVDTEGTLKNPWSIQIFPDKKIFYSAKEKAPIPPLVSVHSGLHDAEVIERMGYRTEIQDDSLQAAYHLGLPLGLKELTVRELGVVLTPYTDMIADRLRANLRNYFSMIDQIDEFHVKVGRKHTVAQRVQTLVNGLEEIGSNPHTVYAKWNDKQRTEVRLRCEEMLGELPYPTLDDIPFDAAEKYANDDPQATYYVMAKLADVIKKANITSAYRTDIEVQPMIVSMRKNGLPIDLKRVEDLKTQVEGELADIKLKFFNKYGPDFNPSSPIDKVSALEGDGIELTKKSGKSGRFKTDKNILKALSEDSEVARDLVEHSKLEKLNNTYVPALTTFIDKETGKIHCTWRMSNADTGRLSASNPNIMAFPERTEIGKKFKKCFVAPEGWVFANADLDQIEMRVMAHLSNETKMIQAIWDNKDLHTDTASYMFGIPYDDFKIHPEYKTKYRFPAKTINFLMIFEGGPTKLQAGLAAEGVDYERDYCKQLIDKWFSVYPGIREYQRVKHVEAETLGYVTDFFGRIRHVEGARAANKMVALECQRQAGNFPVQSTAQILMKRAMVRIWKIMQLPKWRDNVKIVFQIHDELGFLIRKGFEHFMTEVVQVELTRDQHLLKVPLSSSVGFGASWGDLK